MTILSIKKPGDFSNDYQILVEILILYLPSEQKNLPKLIYPTYIYTSSSGAIIIQIGYGQRVYEDHGKDLMEINKKRTDITNAAFVRLW
jgi:hypothetical protein